VIDPRGAVVEKRLVGVGRIVAFCSAKGGVGKTFCTSAAGLALAASGRRVGILDLDLQGASVHVFLGLVPTFPAEDRGILPLPVRENLSLMSAAAFTGEKPLPLRGSSVTDAMLELLAVTRWGSLDYLLIDMPPGIGEEILDLARLVPRLDALVVSSPALVSVTVVERLLALLARMNVNVPGLVANMARGDARSVGDLAKRAGVRYAGEVPWEPGIEAAVGRLGPLLASPATSAVLAALRECGLAGGEKKE
jgi:ATP-binding protein involved in chromosome partitioning